MWDRIRAALFATCAFIAFPLPAGAWDYPGHRIVGAIADLVLQQHYPDTYRRVSGLLELKLPNGVVQKRSLREVAVFPDCAKRNNEAYCGRPTSQEEERYVERNKFHDKYHYTDVPLQLLKYVAGSAGTNEIDIVHMINHIVAQLRAKGPSEVPEKKGVNLTDVEAIWLLAHLVGDIHQPLHVGAKYYDETCEKAVDPNTDGKGLEDFGIGTVIAETVGGNSIGLPLSPPAVPMAKQLHLYWDSVTVFRAMQAANVGFSELDFAKLLATELSAEWAPTGSPDTWAEQWVVEIMPLAISAHDLLIITKDKVESPKPKIKCTWKTAIDTKYEDWAKEATKRQLQKAGFRLAALLHAIFPR